MTMCVVWCMMSGLLITTVTGVEVTCDPDTDSSSSEGDTFIVQNMNQLNSHPDLADGRCTKIRGDLKIQCQQDIVANRNGGQIQNISWLSNVVEITGYLHLEDCDDITTLEPLKKLRTIGGSPGKGLYIFACSSLEDVKGLENLRSIAKGGVKILRNQILCFADLMYWSRITDAAGEIQVLQVSQNCTSKICASDCHCGFCGGSGSCNQQENCDDFWYDTPGWVNTSANTAGYAIVILFSFIFTVLFIYIIVQCFRKKIKVKIYVSSIRPAPEASRGFRPIVNRKLNLDAQRRLGSIVPSDANEHPPLQPSLSGFSLPGLVESKEDAQPQPPNIDEQHQEEEVQQEPDPITNRPLKPFSNFLHRERKLIETTLVSRKSTHPNISAQKVAADLWQGSSDIQKKFKTEYARDFQLFSEYVGKGEWVDSGAGTWQQWVNDLDSETKNPYIAAGLEKDKVRRRMQRNARKSLANSSAARLSRASFGSFDDLRAPEPVKPELPRLTGLSTPRSQPTLTLNQPETMDVES